MKTEQIAITVTGSRITSVAGIPASLPVFTPLAARLLTRLDLIECARGRSLPPGPEHECFSNSARVFARHGWPVAVGLATQDGTVLLKHAWNLDHGQAADATWTVDYRSRYLAVAIGTPDEMAPVWWDNLPVARMLLGRHGQHGVAQRRLHRHRAGH